MPDSSDVPPKVEAFEAFREGELSWADARRIFGDELDAVCQLRRIAAIPESQPEPDVESDELSR